MDKFHDRSWDEIYKASYKVLTFIDVAASPSYTKSLLEGSNTNIPNYAMIFVVANQVSDTCKEHIKLTQSLQIPFVIIISKIDKVDEDGIIETIEEIEDLINEDDKCNI